MYSDMKKPHHPDSHELHDWHLYGPKNSEIVDLVERLAFEHGWRVARIELLIVDALKARLREEVQQSEAD